MITRGRIAVAVLVSLCVLTAASLLHSACAAFSWQNFHFLDYGGYTNMLWNSGHGHLFKVLVDRSYLNAHLSFTLALLGPAFRVWDHPFLLSLMQWLVLVSGAVVIWRVGLRRRIGPAVVLSIVLFYVGYPFTQGVMLSEFHGVAVYYLLVPWLYYCLCFRETVAWIPLVLLLGVREDAFLVACPLLLYFAIRQRSRRGYVLVGISLLYGLLAIFVLFPAINGLSLLEFRSGWLPGAAQSSAADGNAALTARLRAALWVLLPTLLLLKRGWVPILSFVLVPLATAMASASHYQYSLRVHYPAAVMVCLTVAIIEAAAISRERRTAGRAVSAFAPAVFLVVVTIASHFHRGYLPGGGQHQRVYGRVNPAGAVIMAAARHIPAEGTLLCPERLSPFCANRADIVTWEFLDRRKHKIDLVFLGLRDMSGRRRMEYEEMLRSGEFGLRYFKGSYIIMERGFDTKRNVELLRVP